MSTLADIVDQFLNRIPDNRLLDILHGTNMALRAMAKRLYFHESDLVRGLMSVPVWAAQDYTASMAFTANATGVAATITDAAAQFIVQGFKAGMHITTDSATNPGPFTIAVAAAGALTLALTDVVTAHNAATITITSDGAAGDLPSDFWGLLSKPWLDGYRWPLSPLATLQTQLIYQTAGLPKWYELRGSQIALIPPAASDYTVKGFYFQKPPVISDMLDVLPYNELFDDVLQELIIDSLTTGLAITGDRLLSMKSFINDNVDMIVSKRPKRAPVNLPGGNDYEMMWGSPTFGGWR